MLEGNLTESTCTLEINISHSSIFRHLKALGFLDNARHPEGFFRALSANGPTIHFLSHSRFLCRQFGIGQLYLLPVAKVAQRVVCALNLRI